MTSNLNLDIGTLALNITNVDKNEILNMLYPVGSVYISMNITSPSELFGGEWTRITDCFLWCTHYSSKATGGSKKISEANLPAHTHTFSGNTQTGEIPKVLRPMNPESPSGIVKTQIEQMKLNAGNNNWFACTDFRLEIPCTGSIGTTGSGSDYMPPYMTVYAWYRTA